MKLYDTIVGLEKTGAYDYYVRFVDEPKKYERVTRKQMATEIIKVMLSERFLFHFITERSLYALYLLKNKLDNSVLDDYNIIIYQLQKRLILDENGQVYEEIADVVNELIDNFDPKKFNFNGALLIDVLIGILKESVGIPVKVFVKLASDFFNKPEDVVRNFMYHPLFRYYSMYDYDENIEDDIVLFNYDLYINEIIWEKSRENKKSFNRDVSLVQYKAYTYDGFDSSKEAGKKLLNIINDNFDSFAYEMIIYSLQTGDFEILDNLLHKKCPNIADDVMEVIKDVPSVAYSGISYNEYKSMEEGINKVNLQLSRVRQVNACLSREDADLFYKIYFALLEYTNKAYKINASLKIYNQLHVDPYILARIDDKLWENIRFIVKNFVKENPFNFTKSELKVVEDFKKCTKKGVFVLVGFEEDGALFVGENDVIYKVKGVRCNIDQIVDKNNLPKGYMTVFLMFKGHIIYNSILAELSVELPVEIINQVGQIIQNGKVITKIK